MVEKISYRNHKGVFKNPDDAINSFFECVCIQVLDDETINKIKEAQNELT